jgi:hypothetical protein
MPPGAARAELTDIFWQWRRHVTVQVRTAKAARPPADDLRQVPADAVEREWAKAREYEAARQQRERAANYKITGHT